LIATSNVAFIAAINGPAAGVGRGHGGVFDAAEKPKPALEALRAIRQKYLNGGKG
jgi:hypothetical protein